MKIVELNGSHVKGLFSMCARLVAMVNRRLSNKTFVLFVN